jgi:hypothetical protein
LPWPFRELSEGWNISNSTMSAKNDYRWKIYHRKHTAAKFIGTVSAPDEDSALKTAIVELQLEPKIWKRMAALRQG